MERQLARTLARYEWVLANVADGIYGLDAHGRVEGWLARWWRRTPEAPVAARSAPWWSWALVVGTGAATGAAVVALTYPDIGVARSVGTAWGGGAALALAAGLSAAWHLRRRSSG